MWNVNASLIDTVPGLVYTMLNRRLLPIVMSKSPALDGNFLALDPLEGPLVMTLLSIIWGLASDVAAMMSAAKALIEQIEAATMASGVDHAFKFLNYAYAGQDVFDGYGRVNKARLRSASKAYDPTGVFQTAVPGGF